MLKQPNTVTMEIRFTKKIYRRNPLRIKTPRQTVDIPTQQFDMNVFRHHRTNKRKTIYKRVGLEVFGSLRDRHSIGVEQGVEMAISSAHQRTLGISQDVEMHPHQRISGNSTKEGGFWQGLETHLHRENVVGGKPGGPSHPLRRTWGFSLSTGRRVRARRIYYDSSQIWTRENIFCTLSERESTYKIG